MLEKGLVNGYGSLMVEFVRSGRGNSQVLCGVFGMDNLHSRRCPMCETTDIHIVLRRQVDLITDNRNLIFHMNGRMHAKKETRNNEYAFILETLHSQKRQVESL
jgi:hypothetical protein